MGGRGTTARARDGNEPEVDYGFEQFCRDRYARLVGMLALFCGDRDLAEDLTQEALARLCRVWDRFETVGDAERWTTRVAFNLAKSSFRTRQTRSRILASRGHLLQASDRSADDAEAIAVRKAVLELPARQRRVIVLRYFADLSIPEVADVLRCPEGTVKTLARQAILQLRTGGWEASDD